MKKIPQLIALLLVVVMLFAACTGNGTPASDNSGATSPDSNTTTPGSDNTDPIRIGVLVPLTGPMAALGIDAMDGTKLAFEEADYTVGGRRIELFFEDTQGDPSFCIQKVARLVERENVDLILGPLSGGEATALKEYSDSIPDVTVIVAGAASEDVTMRGVKENVYRTAYTGAQVAFEFGTYAYKELGYKKILTLGENYDFPFSQIGGFIMTYVLAGGEIVNRLWVEVGTTDYSSIIAQIPDDIDALFTTLGGTDGVNFMSQLQAYGRLGDFDIIGGSTAVDTTMLTTDVGYMFDGIKSCSHYAQVLPYPEFDHFDSAFMERNGRPSSLFAADFYIGAQVTLAALGAVDGNVEDQSAFREALAAVKMDTARGPFRFDEYHNVVLNVYINEVQNINGQLRNVPFKTFEDCDEFGPFDPEWYQAQPSYSETNPNVDNIKTAILR